MAKHNVANLFQSNNNAIQEVISFHNEVNLPDLTNSYTKLKQYKMVIVQ